MVALCVCVESSGDGREHNWDDLFCVCVDPTILCAPLSQGPFFLYFKPLGD